VDLKQNLSNLLFKNSKFVTSWFFILHINTLGYHAWCLCLCVLFLTVTFRIDGFSEAWYEYLHRIRSAHWKFIIDPLVKRIRGCYGLRRIDTVIITIRQCALPWLSSLLSMFIYYVFKDKFNVTYPSTPRSPKCLYSWSLTFLMSYVIYLSHPA
jgi:hypothetical protein